MTRRTPSRPTVSDLLQRAALHLEIHADELRRSHTCGPGKRGRWLIHDDADRRAREDYHEWRALARELRRAAKGRNEHE